MVKKSREVTCRVLDGFQLRHPDWDPGVHEGYAKLSHQHTTKFHEGQPHQESNRNLGVVGRRELRGSQEPLQVPVMKDVVIKAETVDHVQNATKP
jgi:hypothetical protein